LPRQCRNPSPGLVQFLLRRLQLSLQRHDQFGQPLNRDPPLAGIVLELLNVHASFIINLPKSRSASFTEWTTTKIPVIRKVICKGSSGTDQLTPMRS
jgi:hypothetical protein